MNLKLVLLDLQRSFMWPGCQTAWQWRGGRKCREFAEGLADCLRQQCNSATKDILRSLPPGSNVAAMIRHVAKEELLAPIQAAVRTAITRWHASSVAWKHGNETHGWPSPWRWASTHWSCGQCVVSTTAPDDSAICLPFWVDTGSDVTVIPDIHWPLPWKLEEAPIVGEVGGLSRARKSTQQ